MNTTSHLIYNWALAKKTEKKPDNKRLTAFLIGAFLPDSPTYLFFFIYTFIFGASQRELWDTIYFNSAWTPVITLSHSFLLWPFLVFFFKYIYKNRFLFFVSVSSLVHVVIDFFVHHDDAYRHFWPVSEWKFISPISYWDPNHFGMIVSTLDSILVLLLLVYLYRQYETKKAKRIIIGLGVIVLVLLILPVIIFA